ncbi:phytanoyl-CoA dioxygenase, peroxisomal-like isoform X1 [Branchiostoma lanceolatum]|uniref:phytanoyl-CoA dioxygenase, peroxisomal-like isoform X1 n=1 Tax=Branchiostoma lanceolatum TaxID=7740 RepID=UPI0034530248
MSTNKMAADPSTSEPVSKKARTGEGLVSTWPKFTHRMDQDEVKTFFKETGYIKVPDFLSEDELAALNRELTRYRREVVPNIANKDVFYEEKDNPDTIIRLERMQTNDDFFKDLGHSPAFNGLADLLLGEDMEPNNVQFFSKPPGAKPTPPHQDGKYFMHDKGITFWLALDDADEENGCLYYVPGTHLMGELQHEKSAALGFSQGLADYSTEMQEKEACMAAKKGNTTMAEKEVCMAVKKGSLLGHHPYTVHRAGKNSSPTRWRPALGLTYWAKSCQHDEELKRRHKEYQQKLLEELENKGRI